MVALTLYGSGVADATLTTAGDMSSATGGVETSKRSTPDANSYRYTEILALGGTSVTATSIPATPTGHGWVYKPGAGVFTSGNWTSSITLAGSGLVGTPTLTLRIFKYSGGSYTSLGSGTSSMTSSSKTTYSFTASSVSAATLSSSDFIYFDLWQNESLNAPAWLDVYVSTSATQGVANDVQVTTATFTPTAQRILICDGYGGTFS